MDNKKVKRVSERRRLACKAVWKSNAKKKATSAAVVKLNTLRVIRYAIQIVASDRKICTRANTAGLNERSSPVTAKKIG
jgi:hypothetical protein